MNLDETTLMPSRYRNKLPRNKCIMPFGKYKGHYIQDIVTINIDYARWLATYCNINETLKQVLLYYINKKEERMNKQIASGLLAEKKRLYPEATQDDLIQLIATEEGMPKDVIIAALEEDD